MSSKFTKPFSRVGRKATVVVTTRTAGASHCSTWPMVNAGAALRVDVVRMRRGFFLIPDDGWSRAPRRSAPEAGVHAETENRQEAAGMGAASKTEPRSTRAADHGEAESGRPRHPHESDRGS